MFVSSHTFYMCCGFPSTKQRSRCPEIYLFFLIILSFRVYDKYNLVNKINSFLLFPVCLFFFYEKKNPRKEKISSRGSFQREWIRNGYQKFVVLIRKGDVYPTRRLVAEDLGIRTIHSIYSSVSFCAVTAGIPERRMVSTAF